MNSPFDFNGAEDQAEYSKVEIIPKGTIAKVRMTIRPGLYREPARGWTDGYPTLGKTGSIYLDCEFVVLEGLFALRHVWSLIGLHSEKAAQAKLEDTWAKMGNSFIKSILNSARGLTQDDNSPRALEARRIKGYGDLDGLEFTAIIDVETDDRDDTLRNVIKKAVVKKSESSMRVNENPLFQPSVHQTPQGSTQGLAKSSSEFVSDNVPW